MPTAATFLGAQSRLSILFAMLIPVEVAAQEPRSEDVLFHLVKADLHVEHARAFIAGRELAIARGALQNAREELAHARHALGLGPDAGEVPNREPEDSTWNDLYREVARWDFRGDVSIVRIRVLDRAQVRELQRASYRAGGSFRPTDVTAEVLDVSRVGASVVQAFAPALGKRDDLVPGNAIQLSHDSLCKSGHLREGREYWVALGPISRAVSLILFAVPGKKGKIV